MKGKKQIEPENQALIYNLLGYAYFSQEQIGLVVRNYKEAIQLYTEHMISFKNLANAYENK
ncbi:MAG: hypothetical protein ACQJCO_01815 [cyanobacterium endosymbiont of Rhopalodia sterrenbergii]